MNCILGSISVTVADFLGTSVKYLTSLEFPTHLVSQLRPCSMSLEKCFSILLRKWEHYYKGCF